MRELDPETYAAKKARFNKVIDWALPRGICIAFSGGTDSATLLAACTHAARNTEWRIRAAYVSTFLQAEDTEEVRKTAAECGVELAVFKLGREDMTDILHNPTNRCYLCKRRILTKVKEYAASEGCQVVMDGTNGQDFLSYRPGILALEELKILSPLAEAEFLKTEVRELAKELGVSVAAKPSESCLATRLPYGAPLDADVLGRISLGEKYLKSVGLTQVRIRLHEDIARIEVTGEELELFMRHRDKITETLKKLGFKYITLDLEGFRSGSMDQ